MWKRLGSCEYIRAGVKCDVLWCTRHIKNRTRCSGFFICNARCLNHFLLMMYASGELNIERNAVYRNPIWKSMMNGNEK